MSALTWILLFLTAVVFHELAHGLAAYALGDPTAKQAGRLSLNPLRHVDPFWTLLLPALIFFSTHGRFAIGMAKPVPVNFNRLHHPKGDMIWVALAGPLMNLFLAAAFKIAWDLFGLPTGMRPALLMGAVYFNLGLALFNLVPIPPLDGSRVVAGLLPVSWARRFLSVEPFGFLIISALYFSGVLFYFLIPAVNFFCRLLQIPSPAEF